MRDAPPLRTQALTVAALVAFAANSLLARQALGTGLADAAAYTAVRLVTGALMLLALLPFVRRPAVRHRGTWASGAALFAYAIAFSAAYLRIPAGLGALVLFGAVQITMIGWGLVRGERPGLVEWLGVAVAVAGLAWLAAPGAAAPDLQGAALMGLAGVAWGVYSLKGRGIADPLGATAGNFVRATAFGGLLAAWPGDGSRMTAAGLVLATLSGSVASGLGYTLWYAAVPGLTALRAAAAQLAVPVVAAAGAVILLDERVTARLMGAGILVLGGIAIALFGRRLLERRDGV